MENHNCSKLRSLEARRRCEQRHARLMFGVAFPLCLVAAIVARLMPGSRRISGIDGRRSLISEAWTTASMCIPFAFR
jgi:hypothetical protein